MRPHSPTEPMPTQCLRQPARRAAWPAAAAALVCAVTACGDNQAQPDAAAPGLEVVGHADLGGRGMNAALAVIGDTVYVGSRVDGVGVAIVDASDPRAPHQVGVIGAPDEAVSGMSSRELRGVAERDLLVVLNLTCSADLHGCADAPREAENLRFYDVSDRRAPRAIATYPFTTTFVRPTSPHEMFLWRDPAAPGRILLLVSTPLGPPALQIIDASDPRAPRLLVAWDPQRDGGFDQPRGGDSLLHSISASDDGRIGYASHLQGGLFAIDLGQVADGGEAPALSLLTPPDRRADWAPPEPAGPHSTVPVPGRPLLVATDEVYPPPYGSGCPWGWMRMVDVADPTAPTVVGELRLDDNADARCGAGFERTTFTAHNATATEHLALVSWHSAGLVVADISDASAPRLVTRFLPEPLAQVTTEDPALGGDPVLMWSTPVIKDGLIYVVDIRNGLYILRYHGPHEDEIAGRAFAEGNSGGG
jgi:hypothetical protein